VPVEPVERKLAAIFAADIAGYSRLMARDEVATLARLKACRIIIDGLIASHRGRIFNTAGDSVVADFASAVDAVQCAVAVQAAIATENAGGTADEPMQFRVGVHVGDVMVDGENLLGDGVNIAARLEGLAEPGAICVSAVVRDQVGNKLPLSFDDLGEQQVKNMARPVRVYRVTAQEKPMPQATLPLPDKPSLAVLPFANMSNDPEQEFFSDGIAEDIITALSRYPSLFVIARNSCFTYKGRAVDVKQVGRELGVRYVLEGSMRKAGNRIRVTAQLVETETGKHVWAERYDRDLADIFAVQDEITEAVTIAIAPAIARAEQQRAMRKSPESLDAWGAYQRGLSELINFTADANAAAEKFFEQAIRLDPTFSGGYVGLAYAKFQFARLQRRGLSEALSSIKTLARRAITLDSSDAGARSCLSWAFHIEGDQESAIAEAERALALCPNLGSAHRNLGAALLFSGRPREGLASLEAALRLDPRNERVLPHHLLRVAIALYYAREYESAVEAAKRAIRAYPDFPFAPYQWVAAALGQLERTEEARAALEKAIAVTPAAFDPFADRPPWIRPEDRVHLLEGLRKAGWEG
jgi:adenylate cyclase